MAFLGFNYETVLGLWWNIRKYNDWANLREATEGVRRSVVLLIKAFLADFSIREGRKSGMCFCPSTCEHQ